MDKEIPSPEFPLEPTGQQRPEPPVLPIPGILLFLSFHGAMIVLYIEGAKPTGPQSIRAELERKLSLSGAARQAIGCL
jgi:hypothetical protein